MEQHDIIYIELNDSVTFRALKAEATVLKWNSMITSISD